MINKRIVPSIPATNINPAITKKVLSPCSVVNPQIAPSTPPIPTMCALIFHFNVINGGNNNATKMPMKSAPTVQWSGVRCSRYHIMP